MSSHGILNKIYEMGINPEVSVEDIDDFVDGCIAFLKMQTSQSPGLNLDNDIFEIEDARQNALVDKYSQTVQKL